MHPDKTVDKNYQKWFCLFSHPCSSVDNFFLLTLNDFGEAIKLMPVRNYV